MPGDMLLGDIQPRGFKMSIDKARDSIFKDKKNTLILGAAGTGKTYFLKNETKKSDVILSFTGLASTLVGGQTSHSFFKFPLGFLTSSTIGRTFNQQEVLKKVDRIFIDEISMIRADMFHAMDFVLRKTKKKPKELFGGVQIVGIGDFFQLPPIVTREEQSLILGKYRGEYFFNSPSYRDFKHIEFKKNYRQTDLDFLEVLDRIRRGYQSRQDIEFINDNAGISGAGVYLSSLRREVDQFNEEKFRELKGRIHYYKAITKGDIKENEFQEPSLLKLKTGCKVMITSNGKGYHNGYIGKITKLGKYKIEVDGVHSLEPLKREKFEYVIGDNNEIEKRTIASFKQFPLRLAYAMTIHKSQGQTFDEATMDLSNCFSPGQAYVALSRCRTVSGITLKKPLRSSDIKVSMNVRSFVDSCF